MRKIFVSLAAVFVFVLVSHGVALAASSIVAQELLDSAGKSVAISEGGHVYRIKLACTADTDGTFTSQTLSSVNGFEYWRYGFRIANVVAVNPASGHATVAAAVTITDGNKQLVGTAVGDTLTLSTSASGVAHLSVDRSSSQRLVTSPLVVAIGDTGTAANTVTIYIELERF